MEFSFFISQVLPMDNEGFALLNCSKLQGCGYHKTGIYYKKSDIMIDTREKGIAEILDRIGEASSKAQGLKQVITNYSRCMSTNHRVYFRSEGKKVFGLLKVGEKKLFYRDSAGNIKEITPLCVLDFYVHESLQRSGIGKQIFEKMLENENISPDKIAYDKPSIKLISFLKKHYGLYNYVPQNNNFVIFREYFEKEFTSIGKNIIDKRSAEDYKNFDRNENIYTNSKITNPELEFKQNTKNLEPDYNKFKDFRNTNNYNFNSNKKPPNTINSQELPEKNTIPTKSKRENIIINDIDEKIKKTEEQIKLVQSEISKLSQKPINNRLASDPAINYQQPQYNYNVRPPWANSNMEYTKNARTYGADNNFYRK